MKVLWGNWALVAKEKNLVTYFVPWKIYHQRDCVVVSLMMFWKRIIFLIFNPFSMDVCSITILIMAWCMLITIFYMNKWKSGLIPCILSRTLRTLHCCRSWHRNGQSQWINLNRKWKKMKNLQGRNCTLLRMVLPNGSSSSKIISEPPRILLFWLYYVMSDNSIQFFLSLFSLSFTL